jgi:hypothetical protein
MEIDHGRKPRHAHFADQLTRASFVNSIRSPFWYLASDTEIQPDRTVESAVSQRYPLCARSCEETHTDGVEQFGKMLSLTSKKHQQLMKSEERA